jgi:hypothetical protein
MVGAGAERVLRSNLFLGAVQANRRGEFQTSS